MSARIASRRATAILNWRADSTYVSAEWKYERRHSGACAHHQHHTAPNRTTQQPLWRAPGPVAAPEAPSGNDLVARPLARVGSDAAEVALDVFVQDRLDALGERCERSFVRLVPAKRAVQHQVLPADALQQLGAPTVLAPAIAVVIELLGGSQERHEQAHDKGQNAQVVARKEGKPRDAVRVRRQDQRDQGWHRHAAENDRHPQRQESPAGIPRLLREPGELRQPALAEHVLLQRGELDRLEEGAEALARAAGPRRGHRQRSSTFGGDWSSHLTFLLGAEARCQLRRARRQRDHPKSA